MAIKIKKCVLFAVVLHLFLITGCSNPDIESDTELKNTVRLYNALLAEGYRKLNMNALKQVSTQKRAMQAYYHMAAFGEGKVKMDAQLKEIKFLSVSHVSSERANVGTAEKWHYVYNSTETGEKKYENNVSYLLLYKLIKGEASRWLVDDIVVEKMEEGHGQGELPFLQRPSGKLPRMSQ